MTLELGYLYCTNLTEETKQQIDKKVHKNRLVWRYRILKPIIDYNSTMPIVIRPLVYPYSLNGIDCDIKTEKA